MFIEKKHKIDTEKVPDFGQKFTYSSNTKITIFVILGLILIVFLISVIFSFFNAPENGHQPVLTDGNSTSTAEGRLPAHGITGDQNGNGFGSSTEDIKAELVTFGQFYRQPKNGPRPDLETYELPINVKVAVSNYHDVSRKLSLDAYIEDFDEYGFTIMDNQLAAQDFFAAYRELINKDIPVVLTSDFLLYYFQNTLKEVFKEIEKNAFYENLWEINKKMFDISLARYKRRQIQSGLVNDPVLESMRRELAYFAVGLKLLVPMEKQINREAFSSEAKFNVQEADRYSFLMPEYLKDDVLREVENIRIGVGEKKSPVLLYYRDYKDFSVPADYRDHAKLRNFYVALKWMNSVFPLYYRSEECPDCLLDYEDWVINMGAAGHITRDMMANQDVKNAWAVIYKFISFFTGLRRDLTYLQYDEALRSLFGEHYLIEDILSKDNPSRKVNLEKWQEEVGTFEFLELEGEIDRDDPAARPYIGMRLLQSEFWPNNYIFDELTGDEIYFRAEAEMPDPPITSCRAPNYRSFYRCRGFGVDIVNLIYDNPGGFDDPEIRENIEYINYDSKLALLRDQIDRFNVNAWHNNVYWVTLDLSRSVISEDREGYPVFMRTRQWDREKDLNLALGGWVNLHLGKDKLTPHVEQVDRSLGAFKEDNPYNYVEPNIDFINDLIAKNNMLSDMMAALNISKKTNLAAIILKELDANLRRVADIAEKELRSEAKTRDEIDFIDGFVKHSQVSKVAQKHFILNFPGRNLRESIQGLDLVVIIYQSPDKKKIMAVGPVFDYQEGQ